MRDDLKHPHHCGRRESRLRRAGPIAAALIAIGMFLLIGAPMVSDLLELSLSRRREFLADAGAVELTGDLVSPARALERIADLQRDDWERFASRGGQWLRWFRTHPTIAERIERLADVSALPRPNLPMPTWSENETAISQLAGNALGQRLVQRLLL